MIYRTLGKTGLRVSVVGIGTWQYGGEWGKDFEQAEVNQMFARGRELGINLIDTAECYGDHLSERFVGAAVGHQRAEWIIASKFGHHFQAPFERTEPRTPADCLKQLDDSLKALQTDYLDILQYHSWGDTQFFDDDVLAVLQKAKHDGKIRFLGNSVGSNVNTKQIQASTARDIDIIQLIYNRLDAKPDTTTLPICAEQNLGVLARVPLASGFLSGKYAPGARFPAGEVRSKWADPKLDETLAEVQRILRDEVPAGVPMAQWALAWCLKNPAVTCVIPGCKSVEQVEDNARAAKLVSA